jgi:hypothetical protein
MLVGKLADCTTEEDDTEASLPAWSEREEHAG